MAFIILDLAEGYKSDNMVPSKVKNRANHEVLIALWLTYPMIGFII